MRLAALLAVMAVGLTGCGHKDYDDFMNNSMSDTWGVLAIIGTLVFAVAAFRLNRSNQELMGGPRVRFEAGLWAVFLFCFGAGIAYLNDPEGWLMMTQPSIITR